MLQLAAWTHRARRQTLPSFFLKPDDLISEGPLLGKSHDEEVVEALQHFGKKFPGLFLDIGANIGLMGMAMAGIARRIECIEPNPLIANILRTNLALHCDNVAIHQYALGPRDGSFTLLVPRGNMGGAFIRDGNEYSEEELWRKEGGRGFNASDLLQYAVDVRSFSSGLAMLDAVTDAGAVVKIDVEGFETQIAAAILQYFPGLIRASRLVILLECHDRSRVVELAEQFAEFGFGCFTLRVATKPDLGTKIGTKVAKLLTGTKRYLIIQSVEQGYAGNSNYALCPRHILE